MFLTWSRSRPLLYIKYVNSNYSSAQMGYDWYLYSSSFCMQIWLLVKVLPNCFAQNGQKLKGISLLYYCIAWFGHQSKGKN